MKRIARFVIAFLYLTIGYWIFSFAFRYAAILLPFAKAESSISMSSGEGYHYLRFSGTPGEVILVFVSGKANGMGFPTPSVTSPTGFEWANVYFESFGIIIFALVSIPILGRILRDSPTA